MSAKRETARRRLQNIKDHCYKCPHWGTNAYGRTGCKLLTKLTGRSPCKIEAHVLGGGSCVDTPKRWHYAR